MKEKMENNANTGKNDDRTEAIARLVPYVKDLVGDRSLRKASEDMGITAAYLSGILKEKYMPSAEVLRKMTDPKSHPQNGVSLEDLMVAAGYQDEYVLNVANKVLASAEQRGSNGAKFEKLGRALIISEMERFGYSFIRIDGLMNNMKGYQADLILEISQQIISEWWIDFRYFNKKYTDQSFGRVHRRTQVLRMLSILFMAPPDSKRKLSLVINDEGVFDELAKMAGNIAYRGDLSIILINEEEYVIEKEIYLSHYWEEQTDSEFYIV